ncbi:hypothetical protein AMTR_s00002p00210900, partial [Amborella trichopoda]
GREASKMGPKASMLSPPRPYHEATTVVVKSMRPRLTLTALVIAARPHEPPANWVEASVQGLPISSQAMWPEVILCTKPLWPSMCPLPSAAGQP